VHARAPARTTHIHMGGARVSAARTDRARWLNVVVETVFPFFRYSPARIGRGE
jgi:hypothetical protein